MDCGFHAVDSGFLAVDSGFLVSGSWIANSTVSGIPDSSI